MAENKKVQIDLLINTANSARSVAEIKSSLKDLKAAALEFGEGSEGFKKATISAGQLNDRLNDVNGSIKVLSGNTTENLTKSFAGVAQAGVGGFQAIMGAQALFGSKNKELQETLVKLQGVMAFSQGLKEFANIGQAAKDFKLVLLSLIPTVATKTAVTEADTIVQKQNTLSLIASGIAAGALAVKNGVVSASTLVVTGITEAFGVTATTAWAAATLGVSLLITGIIALISYWDDISNFFTMFGDEAEESNNKAIISNAKYKESIDAANKSLGEERRRELVLSGKMSQEEADAQKLKEDFITAYVAAASKARSQIKSDTSKEDIDNINKALEIEKQSLILKYKNDTKQAKDEAKKKTDEVNKETQKSQKESDEKLQKDKEDRIKRESDALKKFNESLANEERKKFNDFQLIEAKSFDEKKKLEDEYNALSEKDKKDKLNSFNQSILDIELRATREREELKAKIIADNETKKKDAHQVELDNLYDETEAEFMATSAKSEEEQKAADEQKKRDEELKQSRISTAWSTANAIQSIAASFGEKNKKAAKAAFILQKGISAAQAGIATYESATKAYSALAGIPVVGPGLGIAAAAAAVIAGGLNVKKILSQKFESTSPPTADSTPSPNIGGSSLSGGAQSGPITPPTFNLAGQEIIGGASNMLGNNIGGGSTQQPIKVFVSETDISNISKKVKVIEGNSLFGG